MSRIFGFVSVSIVFGISLAHASEIRSDVTRPNGQTGVDVTVRARPQTGAPVVKDLEMGTPIRTVPAKAPGWIRIVKPASGWIPADTFSPELPGDAPLPDIAAGDTQDKPRRRHRHSVTAGRGANGSETPSGISDPLTPAEAPRSQERSDSDLMLEALTAERGDTPNASRIARVVAQTTMETKKNQEREKATVLPSLWKDPFVDDSVPPAVVRQPRGRTRAPSSVLAANETTSVAPADRAPLDLRVARREIARARAEAAAARTDAEVARAEAARVKAELEHQAANGTLLDGTAGKQGALARRAGCVDSVPVARRALTGRAAGWRDATLTEGGRAPSARKPKDHFQALNATAKVPRNGGAASRTATTDASVGAAVADLPSGEPPRAAAPPPTTAPTPVASAQPVAAGGDSWARGILVVPITPLKRSH